MWTYQWVRGVPQAIQDYRVVDVEPGKPVQNAFIESFVGKFREEPRGVELRETLSATS